MGCHMWVLKEQSPCMGPSSRNSRCGVKSLWVSRSQPHLSGGSRSPPALPAPPARIWGIASLVVLLALDFCLFSFDLKVWPQTRESEVLSFGPYQVFIRNVGSECFSLSGDSDFFQSVCFLHPLEARCVPGSSSAQPLTLTAIIIMLLLLSLAASKMI